MSFFHFAGSLFQLVVLSACSTDGEPPGTQANNGAEILWDRWGVPHIYAERVTDADYAFGWSQMRHHTNLLLELYGISRGRAAEYWGEDYLSSDLHVHRLGLPRDASSILEAQGPEYKARIQAFVDGMNDWARKHPDTIDDDKRQVLPLTATDVVAQIQRTIHVTFVGKAIDYYATTWSDTSKSQDPGPGPGSNAWAIGPSRSASGNPMLLINPHLWWRDEYLFFEAHITAPGYGAYGVALVGLPFLIIAFNENLGWTHTVNPYDGLDAYELRLAENGYEFDGEIRDFDIELVKINVLEANGSFRQQSLEIKRSVHGPVVAEATGRALAVRVAGLGETDRSRLFEQYWQLGGAANADQFEQALGMLQMPMFNVIYADRHGDILYVFNALQPVRGEVDSINWWGVVDGSSSETLWRGYRAYDELPKYRNPPAGFIQNANDSPWTSTFPPVLDPDDYPSDLAPAHMAFRPQSSAKMLIEDESITWDELLEYRKSTHVLLADAVLDELLSAANASSLPGAIEGAGVLADWDRKTLPDSRGAILFQWWLNEITAATSDKSIYKNPWTAEQPIGTPNGLADPSAGVAALAIATARVKEKFGAADVRWGDAVRVRYAGQDHPASVGPGSLGVFRVGFLGEIGDDGVAQVVGGNSFVAVIEFGDKIRATGLLGPGNATEASSGHFGDQLSLHAAGEFRKILFYRDDIEENVIEYEYLK